MFSSQRTPSFVTQLNPASIESLISFKYWTPFAESTRIFDPDESGPKHQTFCESVLSQLNYSVRVFDLYFGSVLGPKSSFSIIFVN
jgi:hypothetical protein